MGVLMVTLEAMTPSFEKSMNEANRSRLQDPTSASLIHGHEPQIVKVDVSTIVNQGFFYVLCAVLTR
jgi:hypothetical protein